MSQEINNQQGNWPLNQAKACLHDACTSCNGSGKKADGSTCVHYISCPCPKCTPTFGIHF